MKTNIYRTLVVKNILSNMNSFAKRIMMIVAVVMMAGSAWAAAGDEITSHTNIVSGKWYYIKGVRTNGTTIEYLTFNDNLGTVNGTSSSTTNGAIPLKFTYESSNWYITTPKGYYVTTTTSNGKLTLTSTPTAVTLGTSSSKITIQGDSYYLQKNGGASNFGSYSGAQQHVTLIEAQTYTVNWSVNGGSCSGSPSTEGQADHKIAVLPTTPVSCDASKVFVGWTNTPISGSTNTHPSVLFTHANGAPTITGDVTYYAVFAIKSNASTLLSEDFSSIVNGNSTSTSGSGNSWSTLTDNFTSSSYVYQAGGAVRLGTGTTGYLVTKELTAAVGYVLTISFGVKGWTNVEGDIGVTADDDEFADPGSISYTSTMSGSFETQEVSVVLTKANPKIKISALSSRAFIDDLVITKATYSEYVTTCCDKLVELSAGAETNATISSFSPSSVPTCSETAANRNVTITVAAATGYEFTNSARLSYSGDGTATYQSGPTDNGDGTYSFVYQFAQNDNGSGTFSVTSATPKNYTISFDANGGTGSMDAVEKAYGTTYDLPASTFTRPTGKMFKCWAEDSAEGTERAVGYTHTVSGDITFYAVWRDGVYSDSKFSCAELTLTPVLATAGTPIFITSAAGKTVRSQDYIEITGSGLTPSTELSFGDLDKFAIKKADGTAISTDENGAISINAYIFYTPDAGATSDGLDELTGISVSVGGAKPKTVVLEQEIYGRHIATDFVIAGKKDGKWYALPADFSDESTPAPVEIAVDDNNDPSVAYTANSNIYNLYGQNSGASGYLYHDGDGDGNPDGDKIKLGMKNNGNKPLFAYAPDKNSLKGDETATVTNNIGKQYWWTLKQTNTSISKAKDAKYTITSSNNPGTLSIKNSPFVWGTYKSGVEELRLIPASDVEYTESAVVAWGQKKLILEVEKPALATQVRAKIGEGSWSENQLMVETRTSVKGTGTRYNYTMDFTSDGFDFSDADNEGKMLIIELLNGSGSPLKATSVIIPRIVAADRTINKTNDGTKGPWNTEVHLLPGVKLTVDASTYSPPATTTITLKELHIYPGATVDVESGTLIAPTLILRNGWDRLSAKKQYEIARLYLKPDAGSLNATNAYADWYIDYDQYYPIAVPWKVTTENMSYVNTSGSAAAGVILRKYDGERRAQTTKPEGGENTNWQQYDSWPTTLDPGHGYAMTARRPAGKAFSIVRMPLTIPSADWVTNGEQGSLGEAPDDTHKDTVKVKAWAVAGTPKYAKGWNFIANPYMSLYMGEIEYTDGTEVAYLNIPDVEFKEFDQVTAETKKLKPSSAFLIQAPKDGTIVFGTANRKLSAPSFMAETQNEQKTIQKAFIVLSGNEAEDMMGLRIGEQYTADYEINADLEKMLSDGNTLRTYMRYGDLNMAYVAINDTLAQEWIPVNVRIPADGEYTFSLHEASKVSELEGVYLIDYQNGDKITNLIEQSYTFSSTAGTINGRFAINAKVGERQTPTGIDAINAGGDINSDKPFKFIYHDKVYIWLNGVIYDTTGKRVK